MRVDGRDITVSGSLLLPLTRRTSDILRLTAATVLLAVVITSSLITRNDWVALERSISGIVGVLTPTQSNLVYLAYGIAILALPFAILIGLLAARQWKMLGAYAAAAAISVLALSISERGIAAPRWHFDLGERLDTVLSQFLDDPRWIAMLAAVLTVSGPWLPARWRRWWWTLLLAFVPIHLVVSAVVPARALLGLSVGWFVGALVVWVVGTPALEVPLDGAVRALARRGFPVSALTVVRPAGRGPLVLSARAEPESDESGKTASVELYGPNQRSGGALRQFWRKLRLRTSETAPLQLSVRRAVEHRALDGHRDRRPRDRQQFDAVRRRRWTAAGPCTPTARPAACRSVNAPARPRSPTSGKRWACCTNTASPTATCAAGRSPSTRARCCSAGSGTPSSVPPTCSCRPTSPNCW